MRQFTIEKGAELTIEKLGMVLSQFQTGILPILQRRYDYYIGKQKITQTYVPEEGPVERPANRIVTNYCRSIVQTYEGYAVGTPVTYRSDDGGAEELMDTLRYNDVADEDSEFFRLGLIFGRGAEICYIDEDKQKRFRTLDPRTVIPIYDNTLSQDLRYVVRFWSEPIVGTLDQTEYTVEVYDEENVTVYSSGAGFSSFKLIEKHKHYFDDVPISIFSLNTEEESIFDCIVPLQDAYNVIFSGSVDNFQQWVDSYLLLKGIQADAEDIARFKENRVLMLDADCDASFLTKDSSQTEIQNLLERTEQKIREIAQCPNFADETFGTSSGIAIRYRCMGLENNCSAILNNFRKALQRRIELLSYMISLVNGEQLFRDIDIVFTRNLPIDMAENASLVTQLQGVVSDETLLSLLPFVQDPAEELERVKKQKEENMSEFRIAMGRPEDSDVDRMFTDKEDDGE